MAEVLEPFKWPFSRRVVFYGSDFMPIDPQAQQLLEAKEILAEVHGIVISQVEEMIHRRMVERTWRYEEEKEEPWPEMLWVER